MRLLRGLFLIILCICVVEIYEEMFRIWSNSLISQHSEVTSVIPSREFSTLEEKLNTFPSDKPRAAIYFLMQASEERMKKLLKGLSALYDFYLKDFDYPIIIFHEEDFGPHYRERVKRHIPSSIYFQQVEFHIPEFITGYVPKIACARDVGYRHMCRFNAKLVCEQPIVQNLEYLWRLDDDSLILKPITYDVFRYMKAKQYKYGYNKIMGENHKCIKGLWDTTRKFIKKTGINPKWFHKWREPFTYYNNFEIMSTEFCFSRSYKDYVDFVDHAGGIYYHRWGDHVIRSIAVSLFLHQNETHKFDDLGYCHQYFVNHGK